MLSLKQCIHAGSTVPTTTSIQDNFKTFDDICRKFVSGRQLRLLFSQRETYLVDGNYCGILLTFSVFKVNTFVRVIFKYPFMKPKDI